MHLVLKMLHYKSELQKEEAAILTKSYVKHMVSKIGEKMRTNPNMLINSLHKQKYLPNQIEYMNSNDWCKLHVNIIFLL